MDWSDHAMWWPEKNTWLDKTRWTLDQYNITADATVHFTPMHKTLRIQLPDLRYMDCNVDFSIRTFTAVINICSELGECFIPSHKDIHPSPSLPSLISKHLIIPLMHSHNRSLSPLENIPFLISLFRVIKPSCGPYFIAENPSYIPVHLSGFQPLFV